MNTSLTSFATVATVVTPSENVFERYEKAREKRDERGFNILSLCNLFLECYNTFSDDSGRDVVFSNGTHHVYDRSTFVENGLSCIADSCQYAIDNHVDAGNSNPVETVFNPVYETLAYFFRRNSNYRYINAYKRLEDLKAAVVMLRTARENARAFDNENGVFVPLTPLYGWLKERRADYDAAKGDNPKRREIKETIFKELQVLNLEEYNAWGLVKNALAYMRANVNHIDHKKGLYAALNELSYIVK